MNTLAALEHYNSLCDELDSYMQEENSHLRSSGGESQTLVSRKRDLIGKLGGAFEFLKQAGPVKSAEHAASNDVRKRVLAKLLKLLLLSRESEQLLLKHTVRTAPRAETFQPAPARVANAYQTSKPKPAPRPATTQAEGSWSVW